MSTRRAISGTDPVRTRAIVETAAAVGLLGAVAALHALWAAGGRWGLELLSGGAVDGHTAAARVFFAVVAAGALLTAGAVAIVARVPSARLASPRLVLALAAMLAVGGIYRAPTAPFVTLCAWALAGLLTAVALAASE